MVRKDDRTTISIPREFYERILRIIEDEKLGYDSATDLIKEAIRAKLKELDPEGSTYIEEKNDK